MAWASRGSGEEELLKDRGNDGRGGTGLGEEKDVRAIGETGRRKAGKRTGQQVSIVSLAKAPLSLQGLPRTQDSKNEDVGRISSHLSISQTSEFSW